MRKIVALLVLLASAICLNTKTLYAENNKEVTANVVNYNIFINGQSKNIKSNILNINGRTYIPIRETAELLNLYVVWNDVEKTIEISNIGIVAENDNKLITYNSKSITANITDFRLKIDGYKKQPQNAVAVVDGTSYLPIRELVEMLGFNIEWNGETQTVTINSDIEEITEYGFLLPFHSDNSLWGYMDIEGNVIVEPKYTYAGDFKEGMAAVSIDEAAISSFERGGKYGYIDIHGKEVISCKYQNPHRYSEGLAAVGETVTINVDGNEFDALKYSYINKNGDVAIEGDFYDAGDFCNGYAPILLLNNDGSKHNVYIDKNGNIVKDFGENCISEFNNGYAQADNKLIDRNFCIVLDFDELGYKPVSNVESGTICVCKNNMYGVIDLSGNIIIPFEYDCIYLNSKNPICAVKNKMTETGETISNYGYIDLNNNIILPFEYSSADNFMGNVAFIVKSDKDIVWDDEFQHDIKTINIIDKQGKYIKENIEVGFWLGMDNEYPNGIRKYYHGDKLIYINSRGVFINPKI